MLDWQTIAVILIIMAACLYVGRHGWRRLRSFRAGGKNVDNACATGCGQCPSNESKTSAPATTLVQIRRPGR
ncbi:MAG: hypothetical protein QOF02_483 [Blastocatellia bacterium]|nr:hypothetical protein [Blastocatellia bacterium]